MPAEWKLKTLKTVGAPRTTATFTKKPQKTLMAGVTCRAENRVG